MPASTASPASFIRLISVPPRNSPSWSATAPPPSLWPPPPPSLACPSPSGPPLSKPASGTCSNCSGLRRSGPSLHYLFLAHPPICRPGPKTEVADWYRSSILSTLWELPPERFTSQAFWDAFEQILPEGPEALSPADDPLEQAQLRLLGVWKEKQLVSRRLLAYDTTNFYTYIASTNTRNQLAQRGHNKQGRHNLRQVALSYVLDGEHGLSLCHHVYPGNVADVEEFSTALTRITRMLDQNQIARETVTLVLDKGSAALADAVALEEAGVGWISALPWNQAPPEFRTRATEQLPAYRGERPTRSARRGREDAGASARVSVRSQVFGIVCRRATAQAGR